MNVYEQSNDRWRCHWLNCVSKITCDSMCCCICIIKLYIICELGYQSIEIGQIICCFPYTRHISNWTYILEKTNVCHKHTPQIYSKSLTTLTLMGQKTSILVGSWGPGLCSCQVSLMLYMYMVCEFLLKLILKMGLKWC